MWYMGIFGYGVWELGWFEPEFRLLFGNGLAAKLANSIENKDLLRPPGDVNAPPYI